MFRKTDDRKVWYEWLVEVFILVGRDTHRNGGYRRVRVGMSDLHSSIKDGCLM